MSLVSCPECTVDFLCHDAKKSKEALGDQGFTVFNAGQLT